MSAQYPNVPISAGVPPVKRQGGTVGTVLALVVDAVKIASFFTGPQWGIFLNGEPYLVGSSIVSVDYRKGYNVPKYPIEGGGFQSYNKVEEPYQARVSIASDGTDTGSQLGSLSTTLLGAQAFTGKTNRGEFLHLLESAVADTQLYTVVTPERTYANANVVHFEYSRKGNGPSSIITADVWIEEIRVAADPAFSNTQAPSGATPTSGGTVQPTTPTSAQTPASVPQPTSVIF